MYFCGLAIIYVFTFNPFYTAYTFLYPLEATENVMFFSEGIERDQWHEMSEVSKFKLIHNLRVESIAISEDGFVG